MMRMQVGGWVIGMQVGGWMMRMQVGGWVHEGGRWGVGVMR